MPKYMMVRPLPFFKLLSRFHGINFGVLVLKHPVCNRPLGNVLAMWSKQNRHGGLYKRSHSSVLFLTSGTMRGHSPGTVK